VRSTDGAGTIDGPFGNISTEEQPKSEKVHIGRHGATVAEGGRWFARGE